MVYLIETWQIIFLGERATAFVQGQTTQDVRDLSVESWKPASWVSRLGKLISFGFVGRADDALIYTSLAPESLEALKAHLALPARLEKISMEVHHCRLKLSEDQTGGTPCLWNTRPLRATLTPRETEADAGKPEDAASRLWRIRQALPRWLCEATPDHLPPACGLESTISYTKGCYVGQEIIARVHYKGRPPTQLATMELTEFMGSTKPSLKLVGAGQPAGQLTTWAQTETGQWLALGLVSTKVSQAEIFEIVDGESGETLGMARIRQTNPSVPEMV
jgi:folate-binding protein YgfZ